MKSVCLPRSSLEHYFYFILDILAQVERKMLRMTKDYSPYIMRIDLKTTILNDGYLKIFECLSTCVLVKDSSAKDTGTYIYIPALQLVGYRL